MRFGMPSAKDYVVITELVDHKHYIADPNHSCDGSLIIYKKPFESDAYGRTGKFANILVPGEWYQINSIWTKSSTASILSVKIGISKKNRKWMRDKINTMGCLLFGKSISVGVSSNTFEVSSLDLNGKAEFFKTEEEACALSKKIWEHQSELASVKPENARFNMIDF